MSVLVPEQPVTVFHDVQRRVWRRRHDAEMPPSRRIPAETPVAFAFQGASYAVMMATPADLPDFALGFSLNEGLVQSREDIEELDIVPTADGILLRIALRGSRADAFWERRRYLAGPSGCGLCGLESLTAAMRTPRRVSGDIRVSSDALHHAVTMLPECQTMNRLTGALHAAAFWRPGADALMVREDVGRHNALDKLTGAVAAAGLPASEGVVLLTSRVSVEMV